MPNFFKPGNTWLFACLQLRMHLCFDGLGSSERAAHWFVPLLGLRHTEVQVVSLVNYSEIYLRANIVEWPLLPFPRILLFILGLRAKPLSHSCSIPMMRADSYWPWSLSVPCFTGYPICLSWMSFSMIVKLFFLIDISVFTQVFTV